MTTELLERPDIKLPTKEEKYSPNSIDEKKEDQKTEKKSEFIEKINELLDKLNQQKIVISLKKDLLHNDNKVEEFSKQFSSLREKLVEIYRDGQFFNSNVIKGEIKYEEIPWNLVDISSRFEGLKNSDDYHFSSICSLLDDYAKTTEEISKWQANIKMNVEKAESIKEELLLKVSDIIKQNSGLKKLYNKLFSRFNLNSDNYQDALSIKNFLNSEIPDEEFRVKYQKYCLTNPFLHVKNFSLNSLLKQYCNEYYDKIIGEDILKSEQQELNNQKRYVRDKAKEYLDIIEKKIGEIIPQLQQLPKFKEKELIWERYWEEVVVKDFSISAKDEHNYLKQLQERNETPAQADLLTFQNIRDSLNAFFCYLHENGGNTSIGRNLDKEETRALMLQEVKKVKETGCLVIARSENGVLGILKEGKFKTIWDFEDSEKQKRLKERNYIEYIRMRKDNETAIGISNKKPISCYFESKDGRFENGGPSQYGDYSLVLSNRFLDKAIFSEGDSLNIYGILVPLRSVESKETNIKHRTLVYRHALIAKAMYNLFYRTSEGKYEYSNSKNHLNSSVEYIEARVIEEVSKKDIEYVVCSDPKSIPSNLRKLLNQNSIAIKNNIYE